MTAALVMNAQPHIDNLLKRDFDFNSYLSEMVPIEERNQEFGYCLQHNHFSLHEKEVLLFTFRPGRVDTHVVERGSDMYPCMYYSYQGKYVPVGFTKSKSCMVRALPKHVENVGIASIAFRDAIPGTALEQTEEKDRHQWFLPLSSKKAGDRKSMTTMIFAPIKHDSCETSCSVQCFPDQFGESHETGHDQDHDHIDDDDDDPYSFT
jgi:hypothetical protein